MGLPVKDLVYLIIKISLSNFQHEILNKSPRKLLKDDAIPTLFDCNKDKLPLKRNVSCAQLEIVNEKQLCEETFELC